MVENKSIVREQAIYMIAARESIGTLSGKEAIALAEAAKTRGCTTSKNG